MEEENKNEHCPKCDEYLSGWRRAQADYQNLKKEVEREKSEFAKYANQRLLEDLLPSLDQFTLVLQHVPTLGADQKTWDNWMAGVRAVQSLWEQAAKAQGLERIATDSVFDPTQHEAAGEEAVEGKEPGFILRTVQEGWKLHGKVLRPARVILAK
jgi:molecular chaperone GrpE